MHTGDSSSDPSSAPSSAPSVTDAASPLAPMDFSTFVLSLASTAMVHMGKVPAPDDDGDAAFDLAAAKQIIDILGILEEKTRGNLDSSESQLVTSLLYDLRIQFVDAQTTK